MSKRNPTLLIGGLVAVVVIFTVVLWITQTRISPARTTADELSSISVDGKVGVVAQITAIQGNALTLQVLQGKDYNQRTGAFLQGERGKDHIAMGTESDVKVGAIAQFDGIKTAANKVRLNRITILTGLVKGPPPK